MGPAPRGGAYTYDWIENLFGLNMHSADRVLPSSSTRRPATRSAGAQSACASSGSSRNGCSRCRSDDGNWVWTFVLEEQDGRTRLISRNRFRLPTLAGRIGMAPMEPGSLLMEQKMLRGIKGRAERLAAERPATPPTSSGCVMRASPGSAFRRGGGGKRGHQPWQ